MNLKRNFSTDKPRKEPNMEEHTSELQNHKHIEDLEYFSLKLNSLKDTLDMISAHSNNRKSSKTLFPVWIP